MCVRTLHISLDVATYICTCKVQCSKLCVYSIMLLCVLSVYVICICSYM